MASNLAAIAQPGAIHYVPILTTLLSAAFVAMLLARARTRGWPPHLMWWAFGMTCYGLGTAMESAITLFGNTPELTRWWYWAGAILGGYPLATGSLYLIGKRRIANVLTAVSLVFVIFATVAVFLTPINAEAINPAKPSGSAIEWRWVRLLTPFINTYAAAFLIGGALYSAVRYLQAGSRGQRRLAVGLDVIARLVPGLAIADLLIDYTPESCNARRAAGTIWIAAGALLPGIGGSMAKSGIVEALYVGEFLGVILIMLGYRLCVTGPKPRQADAPALATA